MDTLKKRIIQNILLIWTFAILLFKSICFVGLDFDNTHTLVFLRSALHYILKRTWYIPLLYVLFIIIFLTFVYLFKNSKKLWFLLFLNLFFSVLFVVDQWYIRGYNAMPSIQLLTMSSNLDHMSDSIISLFKWVDLIFIFDIPLILIYILLQRHRKYSSERNVKLFMIVFGITFICLISILPLRSYYYKEEHKTDTLGSISLFDSNVTLRNISPIGYHIYNIYEVWKDVQKLSLTPQQKSQIQTWFDFKKENLPDNKYKAMFKGKNLFIIQVESLEKFVINQKINGQEITPNLNKLVGSGLFFSNYYEQINGGMSSDADLMTNTSVFPIQGGGSTFFRYPFTKYNSLPLLLQDKGYSTYVYHPDKGSFWNVFPALKSIGFQNRIDASKYNMDEVIGLGISDKSYLKQIEPMITKQPQPFYSFIVTLTSHMPFNLPTKERELTLGGLNYTFLGGYLQSVHYTDKYLGKFFEDLKRDNLFNNSVFVIYGDHEGLHRFYPDSLKSIKDPQSWWVDNKKQLPLIIYSPGMQPEEIKTTGGQIDLMPTIAYLMGIEDNKLANSAMGRNLLKTNKDFAVMEKRSINSNGPVSEAEKEHALNGFNITNMLIKSNYFKDFKP